MNNPDKHIAAALQVILPTLAMATTLSLGQSSLTTVSGTITVGAEHGLSATEFLTDRNDHYLLPFNLKDFNASAATQYVGNLGPTSSTSTSSSGPNPNIHDYTFLGAFKPLFGATQNHVTVAFSQTVAVGLALAGKDWNSAFNLDSFGRPNAAGTAFGQDFSTTTDFSEDTIYAALAPMTGLSNDATLLNFFAYADSQTYTGIGGITLGTGLVPIGTDGQLVDFSNATLEVGGTTSAATPEPVALALLPAAAVLLRRRRRA